MGQGAGNASAGELVFELVTPDRQMPSGFLSAASSNQLEQQPPV